MGSQQVGTQKKLAENLTPCLNDELRLFPLFPFQKLSWPSRIFRAGSETHVCLLLRLPVSWIKEPFPFQRSLVSWVLAFFFFFWLYWVYIAVHRGYSRSSGQASHYGSFSYCRAQALGVQAAAAAAHRLNRCSSRAYDAYSSVAGVHRLCCSAACGTLPDECSNPRPLYWQPDSYPLCHQASPSIGFWAVSSQTWVWKQLHIYTVIYRQVRVLPLAIGIPLFASILPHIESLWSSSEIICVNKCVCV